MKNSWMMIAIGGGLLYLWMTQRAIAQPTALPVETTGAMQPKGVTGGDEPMANTYDLQAFPMGTFTQR